MYNQDFFQNINMESNITGDNNYVNQDMDVDVNMMYSQPMNNMPMNNNMNQGVQERVINRTFVHEVPHTCPIHTRIINHHIYKHTYRPVYTCSEENVCSNVECGSCCNFR
ncbi:MAG: hypothetical protein IJ097_01265 [Bacilli bacterium]|nr:hypothetical protein [Bacilli bacterium]